MYYPDTHPVKYLLTATGAAFTPKPENETGFAKELAIAMDPLETSMEVTMRIKNIKHYDQEFSVWGLTVCAQNGTAVIPMNTNDTDLLSNRVLSIWPYTDMSDERIRFSKTHLTVHQDPDVKEPLKLGLDLNDGCVFYHLGEDVFCKQYRTHHDTLYYPDGGCSFETYANDQFIELESLSPLKTVAPGESAILTELWSLEHKDR